MDEISGGSARIGAHGPAKSVLALRALESPLTIARITHLS